MPIVSSRGTLVKRDSTSKLTSVSPGLNSNELILSMNENVELNYVNKLMALPWAAL